MGGEWPQTAGPVIDRGAAAVDADRPEIAETLG
jgi:hypothetical protein